MGISFPGISAPQQVSQRKSDLDGLAELLLAVTAQRRQLAMRREELDLQKQEFEQRKLEGGTRVEGARLDNERKKRELEDADNLQKAREVVNDAIGTFLMKGDRSPKAISELRVSLIQDPKHKKYSRLVDEELTKALSNTEKLESDIATRITQQTEADVKTQTKDSEITRIRADARRAVTLARTAEVQERIARAEERLGPGQRVGILEDMQRSGQTLGIVRRIRGVGPIEGLSDDMTFAQLSGKADAEADAMANNMRVAVEALKTLKDPSLGKAALTQLTTASIFKLPVDIFTDRFMSDDQKAAVPLYATIAQGLNRLVNGARGSDLDFMNARRAIAIKDTDPKKVREQKFLMMTLLPEMLSGPPGVPMSVNIKTVLDRAQAEGVDTMTLMPFRVIEERARAAEKAGPTQLGGTAGEFFEVRP